MLLKKIFETAGSGATSIGSGAIATVPNKTFSTILKREYIALFLRKRKKNRDKFYTLDI